MRRPGVRGLRPAHWLGANKDRDPSRKAGPFAGPHSALGIGVWLLFQNTGCEADSLLSKQSSVSGRRAFMFQPPFGATIPKLWVGRGSGNCTSWVPGLV